MATKNKTARRSASRRPNILHLFTDMQRWDTVGCYGNPVIRTPHLDRIAREGTVFTNAFTPSPVCVAARCSMIYGQYPWHTGCYENGRMPTDGRQTFMTGLTAAGYRTHGLGKCHFTPNGKALNGFETREMQEEGGLKTMEELEHHAYLRYLHEKGYKHICEPYGIRGELYYIPQPSQLPAEDHPTQWIGDRSMAFIEDASESDQPWYLFASFIHPHPPLTPPNPWHKLYRPSLMPMPNLPPDYQTLQTFVNRFQNRYKYRDQGMDLNLIRAIKAYYYACVSFIDYQVGRIMETLEKTGELDNTLILFSTDHGELLGDYNCFGKRSMHDASARVPLIVRYPGRFPCGGRCEAPANLVDLAPTFLAAADQPFSSHALDGVDLAEVACGRSKRDTVFAQIAMGRDGHAMKTIQERSSLETLSQEEARARLSTYMAVSREWKYVYSAPDDQEYLFDRIHDPLETRNRKGLSLCQATLGEMRERMMQALRAGGETAGIADDKWRSFGRLHVDDAPDAGLLIQDMYTPWAQMDIPGYSASAPTSPAPTPAPAAQDKAPGRPAAKSQGRKASPRTPAAAKRR